MAYEKTVWVNGQAPALDADHLNKIEQGIADAVSVTLQTLTDEQKVQARENILAAPGGYGFGERPKKIDDPDKLSGTVDGVYHFASADHPIEGIVSGLLIHYQGNFLTVSSFCRQIFYAGIGRHSWLERIYANGWQPWEWVNPPMELGVEYRTTERFMGSPVYVKLVDFGALPDNTQKDVSVLDAGIMEYGIDLKMITYNKQAFKQYNGITTQVLQNGGITVVTNYNLSNIKAYFLIKYTKTTD